MINQERMILDFVKMAKISSPSFNERVMADYVIQQFNDLGYEVYEDNAGKAIHGNTGNLIVDIPGTIDKTVLLSAHLDTVVPCDTIHVIRENGKIETDKTSVLGGDDKIGIAIILEIVKVLKYVENKPNLKIIISVCEEKGLQGAAQVNPELLKDVDFGYVLDGGDDVGVVTHQAPYRIAGDLIVTGKEAHAGLAPENGINALHVAAHALTKIQLGRIDAITTSNIGLVQGGLAQNIVMKEVVMKYETRSILKENIEKQAQEVLQKFESVCKQFNAKFTHSLKEVTTGYTINDESQAIKCYEKACQQLNIPFKKEASGGASDANIFNKYGVECLVVSVGMREVHTLNEYVYEQEMIDAAKLMLQTLINVNDLH